MSAGGTITTGNRHTNESGFASREAGFFLAPSAALRTRS
jgi:hypothetical protein